MPSRLTTNRPDTFAELHDRLGKVPLGRILVNPAPGTATEEDVVALREGPTRLCCELIEGVLVQKGMDFRKALLSSPSLAALMDYLREHNRGVVFPGTVPYRLGTGSVRY